MPSDECPVKPSCPPSSHVSQAPVCPPRGRLMQGRELEFIEKHRKIIFRGCLNNFYNALFLRFDIPSSFFFGHIFFFLYPFTIFSDPMQSELTWSSKNHRASWGDHWLHWGIKAQPQESSGPFLSGSCNFWFHGGIIVCMHVEAPSNWEGHGPQITFKCDFCICTYVPY